MNPPETKARWGRIK